MNPVEVMEKQDLTVSFAAIARFRAFCRLSDLDDNHVSLFVVTVSAFFLHGTVK